MERWPAGPASQTPGSGTVLTAAVLAVDDDKTLEVFCNRFTPSAAEQIKIYLFLGESNDAGNQVLLPPWVMI